MLEENGGCGGTAHGRTSKDVGVSRVQLGAKFVKMTFNSCLIVSDSGACESV